MKRLFARKVSPGGPGVVGALVILCVSAAVLARGPGPLPGQAAGGLPGPYDVLLKGVAGNNYLGPLLELKSREAQYLASGATRESYLEAVTLLDSFVGEHEEAYAYEDRLLSTFPSAAGIRARYAKDLDASPLDGLRPAEAVGAIAAAAGGRQVVMINEEHRTPVHRALTLRLLHALYARGFRYFAAETLYESDAGLNARGYPTQKTGFYTADPVYADAVRTALRLGYKVVAYEHIPKGCEPKPDNPESCNDERERGQARNLYERTLKGDPRAKVLVHVGRSHNAKVGDARFAFMGRHFRELTGIDPFVVDQVRMSERRSPADEHPLYRYATRKGWVREPAVFRDAAGGLWTDDKEVADVRVFTPRAVFEGGRPTWMRMGGLRAPLAVAASKLKLRERGGVFGGPSPVLVQAFFTGEGADAVPADQVVLYPGRKVSALMLPAGAFRVRAINAAGDVLGEYEVKAGGRRH